MKLNKTGLIRAGIALSFVWILTVSGIAYLQFELLGGAASETFLLKPDLPNATVKHYWFFDVFTPIFTDQDLAKANQNPFGDPPTAPTGFIPIETIPIQPKIFVLNIGRSFFAFLSPLIALWSLGALLTWVLAGFKNKEEPQALPNLITAENPSIPPLMKSNDRKAFSWALILLHVWGAICLKAAADVGHIKSSAIVPALLIAGFISSKYLVTWIESLALNKIQRNAVIISLIPCYFLLAVLIGAIFRIIRGVPL